MLIMTRRIAFLPFSLCLIFLVACAPQEEVLLTATPTAVQSPTETIIWFPATATPTQLPVAEQSPTPDPHPGLGALLLDDDFSDLSAWPTNQSESSAAIISNGRFTLSTSLSGNVVLSTRNEPAFGDFYAEITASPGLCEGEDEYGFIIRSASLGDQYRFGLSCDGRAKVDRILSAAASRPLGWISSPIIPSIMPSNVRLAVWASGSEMRFFVDDVFLFSLENAVIFEGGLGVYVRARGQGTLSVSFSDLQVWALEN
jgi:hypothetical protein